MIDEASPAHESYSRVATRADLANAGLFALGYFIAAEIGYSLSLGPSVGGTFWPPSGVALAVFLVAPKRIWPHLLIGGLLANFVSDQLHGQMLQASVAFALANLSEPLFGAYLLRRILPQPVRLTGFYEIGIVALVAVFVSAPIGAAIGATGAQLWTANPPGLAAGWRTWWVGDAVGALVLTPLTVRLITGWRSAAAVRAHTWIEAAVFVAAVAGVTQVVFSAPPTSMAMPFLVYPVLLWGSIRFGPIGVGGALVLIVLLTSHETAAGHGPFAADHLSLGSRLIALQIYVGVMAVSFHGLSVLWEDRAVNRMLREREEELSHALNEMAEAKAHREQLLEAERFARGEAERASQLKDEFLATLSHELRTPLNAIVGWAHILRANGNDPALLQGVATIERNARAQTKLIDGLLDMSRIMAGKVGLTRARARFDEIVTTAADAMRPAADEKGVRLSVDTSGADGAWIWCDASRMHQVVTNLLGNGVKFTPAGGSIDVHVTSTDDTVVLEVRDSGHGISPDFLPHVFERFRQADGSITRRHGGLGLGLSIVKHILDLHGGSIGVHSDGTDRGATFTVTLPIAAEPSVRDSSAGDDVESASLCGLRLLVVDDEADARELLSRLLSEQGCDVITASSAEEALFELGASRFDLLLSDIGLPGTDGYELLRRIRALDIDQPRTVAVTAFARPEDRERAHSAGFDAHIAKPVNPARLVRTLAQLRGS